MQITNYKSLAMVGYAVWRAWAEGIWTHDGGMSSFYQRKKSTAFPWHFVINVRFASFDSPENMSSRSHSALQRRCHAAHTKRARTQKSREMEK